MASSNLQKGRKRFIAGAVCPGCGAEDKVFVMTEEEGVFRGCNQCDFRDKLEDLPVGTDGTDGIDGTEVQVVKLLN
ncbi:MAG: putative metal-binding protein (TIGR02443 family) [Candidatus Azotimanducaceae bacterium]|jgi:uncharacterized metal-binding protein (TIGR02443 family)